MAPVASPGDQQPHELLHALPSTRFGRGVDRPDGLRRVRRFTPLRGTRPAPQRFSLDLGRRAGGEHRAEVEHDDPVAMGHHECDVVLDQDDGTLPLDLHAGDALAPALPSRRQKARTTARRARGSWVTDERGVRARPSPRCRSATCRRALRVPPSVRTARAPRRRARGACAPAACGSGRRTGQRRCRPRRLPTPRPRGRCPPR